MATNPVQAREGVVIDGNNLNVSNQVMGQLSPAQIKAAEGMGYKINPTLDAIRAAKATPPPAPTPTDKGIGTSTLIQKNPDGTTTTTNAPGYGSQSVGGARMGVSSMGATTTTPSATPAGTPIATTAGTGGQATGYGYETYYNDTKLKGEIPVDFEEWKKKNRPKEDNRIDTSTGEPVSATKPTEPKEATQKPITEQPKPAVPVQVVPNTLDDAFSTLMSGGQLADTKQNFGFKAVYSQFNAINTLDAKTLGQKMSSGEITPQIENLLARYNPEKYAQAKKISEETTVVNDINTNAERLYNNATGTTTPAPVKTSDQMMQDLINGIEKVDKKYSDIVAEAYAANPQIKEKGDKIAVLDDKIDTLDTEIDKMYETYRTKYPDVPQAMLMGMVNRATYGLTQERNALVKESKLLYSQYKDEKDMIDKGIEYNIQQDEKMNERKFELQKILYGDKKEEEIDLRELAQAEEILNESRQYDEKTKEEARLQLYQDAITKLGLTPIKGATLEGLMEQFAGGMKEATDYERNLAAAQLAESRRKIIPNVKPGEMIYIDGKFVQAPGGGGAAIPSGTLVPVNTGNKTVQVDAVAADGLTNAITQMQSLGINFITGAAHRDQAATIKAMGDRVGMPGATAAELRAAGHQIADVGQSKHEGGLAIDLYSDDKFSAPTKKQIEIMEANGWYHPNIPGDAGHFEYVGKPSDEMTDRQYTQYNQRVNSFKAEPLVKSFETALSAGGDILTSLKSENGPGDVGAVFSFMKSLDPESVVKEGEFQLAAKSAGVWEQFKNIPANKLEGTILTPEQRKAFGKLAQEYIKGKAKLYDIKYNDMAKVLKNQGISEANFPTRMSDFIEPTESEVQKITPQMLKETQQEIDKAIAEGGDVEEIKALLGDNADLFDYSALNISSLFN